MQLTKQRKDEIKTIENENEFCTCPDDKVIDFIRYCGNCGKRFEQESPAKKCPECEGTGKVEVVDKYRIHDLIVDIPYRKVDCPKCEGSGEIEETGENEILITAADISNPK